MSDDFEIVERAIDDWFADHIADKEEAYTALERIKGRMEWRPIGTALRDGSQLLLHNTNTKVTVIGQWGKHNHVPIFGWIRPVELYGEEVDGFDPTHWMPLPQAPKGAGDE